MNKGMIKMLQRNTTPYGLMGDDMQKAIKEVGKRNCLYFAYNSTWCGSGSNNSFQGHITYRLKPDYKEPLLFEEIRIAVDNDGLLLYTRNGDHRLDLAISNGAFIGFKYANGKVTAAARMYERKGTYYSKDLKDIQEGCMVHTPTHVVFRIKK